MTQLSSMSAWDIAKLFCCEYSGDANPIQHSGYFYETSNWEEHGYASIVEIRSDNETINVECGTVNRRASISRETIAGEYGILLEDLTIRHEIEYFKDDWGYETDEDFSGRYVNVYHPEEDESLIWAHAIGWLSGLADPSYAGLPEDCEEVDLREFALAYFKAGGIGALVKWLESVQLDYNYNTVSHTLYSHWASYLINGDSSGLDDSEIEACDSYMESEGNPNFVEVGDSYFSSSPDCGGLAGDVSDYVALVDEDCGEPTWIDVRLGYDSGAFHTFEGLADYDQLHCHATGASSVSKESDCLEVAKDLVDQVLEQELTRGGAA